MTAYHALDPAALQSLLTALRDTPWSWKEADVPMLAARLGWEIVELDPGYGADVDPGHGLGPKAYGFSFRDGRVSDVTLRITSRVPEDDAAGQLFLSDVFTDGVTVGTEILGPPTSRTAGTFPEFRWRGDEATINLKLVSTAVVVFWRYNARQEGLDKLARDFEG